MLRLNSFSFHVRTSRSLRYSSWKLLHSEYFSTCRKFSRSYSFDTFKSRSLILYRHKSNFKQRSSYFTTHVLGQNAHCDKSRPPYQCACQLLQKRHSSSTSETLKYITSTDFPPVKFIYDSLITLHDATGLPWWATIVLTTFILRSVVTLPLYIISQTTIARYINVQSELKNLSDELMVEVFHYSRENNLSQYQTNRMYKHEMKKQYNKKMIEENCHPFRAFLVGFVQVPAWVFVTFGLRNLCEFSYANRGETVHDGMSTEGILWFTDLTIADPTFILPVLLGLSNLLITEIHYLTSLSSGMKDTKKAKYIRNFLRVISLGMIPLGGMVPSVLCLYWTSSSVYGVAQNVLIQQPLVRRALGIPWTEGESEQPIKDIIKMVKQKYLKRP